MEQVGGQSEVDGLALRGCQQRNGKTGWHTARILAICMESSQGDTKRRVLEGQRVASRDLTGILARIRRPSLEAGKRSFCHVEKQRPARPD